MQDFLHSPKCLHPHLLIFGLMGQFHQTIILRIFKIYIVIGTIGIEDPCEENRILQGTAAEATARRLRYRRFCDWLCTSGHTLEFCIRPDDPVLPAL